MGTTATRITTADFVTPPELSGWQLAGSNAGRIGGVRLRLVGDAAGTRLADCYQQVPLRVLPPFQFAAEQPSLVYLLNPTAGLMDGDAQLVEITAQAGTRAVVVGQSATRIHPCIRGFSQQRWLIHVQRDAVLVVLPGPAIPFQGCRYAQQVTIDLEPGAGLIWGDIWLAGRYCRGADSEQFQFATLIQDLLIRRAGQAAFRDRFCWQGPWNQEAATWHFGNSPACGSLFVTGNVDAASDATMHGENGACLITSAGDTCFRWQGATQMVIQNVATTALWLAPQLASGATLYANGLGLARGGNTAALALVDSHPWLLSTSCLAPTHWFSSSPA